MVKEGINFDTTLLWRYVAHGNSEGHRRGVHAVELALEAKFVPWSLWGAQMAELFTGCRQGVGTKRAWKAGP